MMKLEHGRPSDTSGRPEKEIRTYDLLDALGIGYDRVDHEAAMTMEACLAVDEILAPASMCKNLMLCNTQKTRFYLLLMPGDKKFKTKELSKQINSARLSFAPGEYMEAYLDISPGSLSVLGLMNDTGNRVQLLIDTDILRDAYICCHPCINTASLKFQTQDLLEKFLPHVSHGFIPVELGLGES